MCRSAAGRIVLLAAWAPAIVGAFGCQARREGFDRFVPPPAAARRALVAALEAWKQGREPGLVPSTSPAVHVVDSHRRPDQAMEGYEILGETLGENARTFTVRLRLRGEGGRSVVRFNVVGLDPVWVFRQEDYDMIAHWEHAMPAE